MKNGIVFCILLGVLLIGITTQAADWAGKPAIGIRGGVWIPYDDRFGPEPYRMGVTGSAFFKYGLTKGLVVDLSIGYATTYDDTTATEDVNLKFMDKDLAQRKLTNIPIGLTLNYYFAPESKVQPYILIGAGVDMWKLKPVEGDGDDFGITDLGGKGGLGLAFWLGENVSLDLQAKATYLFFNLSADDVPGNPDADFNDWDLREFRGYIEPSIGLTYLFGKAKDTDGDGVSDKRDNCPDTPVGALVDPSGCPLDEDGDGIYDGLDQCLGTPAGARVDIAGCPQDSDKDGVLDGLDKCLETPEGAVVDNTGCPIDTDGDGVFDGLDKCPDTQKGCRVGPDGCTLDGDGDGVCDGIDKCPTTPAGTQIDSAGCPVDVKPPVQKITLNIKYATGSFEPDDNAKQVLDELAKTMASYTGTIIEIDGFTDDVGSEASNMSLSQKRANGVMEYLIKAGVEPERMTAKGFGEDPKFFVGDNKTPAGRQANRRVEIISIEQ